MAKEYRSPVVVVLGHVDHGKTTLLDYIRKSHVADKEAGKITQSIGAYSASIPIEGYHTNTITFIDTPGHEAFTKLRSRGALVADIAILIVDATSSVQPQTIESISHIQQANIPFIVAINKVDMQNANPDKIKGELAKHGVLTEGYGGKVPVAPISALKGTGVEDLLEALLIMAAENELFYDPQAAVEAYIIETCLLYTSTEHTTHIINTTNVHDIKKGAYLINTARGGLIDTDALLIGLEEGILAGVGLDVLEDEFELQEEADLLSSEIRKKIDYENLVMDHVLMHHDKVVITPHNAFNTSEARLRILQTSFDNIQAFLDGKPQNLVS